MANRDRRDERNTQTGARPIDIGRDSVVQDAREVAPSRITQEVLNLRRSIIPSLNALERYLQSQGIRVELTK